jgi:membrane protein
MVTPRQCTQWVLRRPWRLAYRVLSGFHRNHGILLSGAVAYYLLLSIVPLFAVILIGLSYVVDQSTLLYIMGTQLELILPGSADALTAQVEVFLANRHVIGLFGIGILLFFSSLAFSALEKAMCVIFHHRLEVQRRHFLVTAIIPYIFIAMLGLGVLLVSLITGALSALELQRIDVAGFSLSLRGATGVVLYLLGVAGLILMLTALYLVMPVGRIAFRHALYGGIAAGLLWELTRHLLTWYFTALSLVDVVYGSLATAIVTLLTFEVAAIILLLGAQVIAEFERSVAEACALRSNME